MKLDLTRRHTARTLLARFTTLVLLPLLVSGGIPMSLPQAAAQPLKQAPPYQQPQQPQQPPTAMSPDASGQGGRIIRDIKFQGNSMLPDETLRYYLGLEVGQPFDQDQLNASIRELWNRSLVDDIQVDATPTADGGVNLLITIKERPILRSISYEGLKRISKTDIQDKLSTQRIRVREGEPMSLGELQRVKALIEELYSEKGYRFAQARFTVEDVGSPNEKRVVFTVDEGDRVRISEIEFEGNTVFKDISLQWQMRNTRQSGPITRVLKKDIYDPAKLQEDLDRVRKLYHGAGYKNVVIGEPQLEVRAKNPNAATAKGQKRRLFLTIPIEEGERWKFGDITLEGNKVYSDQALLRVFKHKEGGWLRQKMVDDGVKSISDLYHNTGYIYAHVEPELVEKPGQVADVVVHINESDQFKVGRIEFQGNDRTMDKVLRRELRVFEGGVVSVGGIRNSVLKVNQLGYFKLNEEDPVDVQPDVESKKVNLVFKGEEADRTELQFGGGWSELDSFFGQFAINTKNFLGRGEQVGLSVQTGRYRDLFDLSYYVPWFQDKPQSIGIRAFDQDLNYQLDASDSNNQQIRNSRGGILTYGRNFRLFQSASVSYNRSTYHDETRYVVPEPLPGDPPLPDGIHAGDIITTPYDIANSSLRPMYLIDSRDSPFEPTRGQRLSVAAEYAGGILGGNNYFLRPEVNYSLFLPTASYPARQVFALNVEGGLVDAFGDENKYPLSPLERFYMGGENSIRGHRFRSIYLRNAKGEPLRDQYGTILGGTSFFQANLEYHFLLGGPFRVLVFADAGNVFGEGQSFDLSRLRYTAGAELRVLVPVFGAPLRFIYAVNLDPQPNDRFENFQFSIGTSF
ncbi:MAG TPA: outer membrane protein assembly factor BamA [Thermoanaerobaculia bacterium]|nr:outer membrane protein assembly factor BamA [Thermoanaerobaculia bacterium]